MNVLSQASPQVSADKRLNSVAADTLWYKDAIIYQLHVKAYADSNNDGIGDFPGLTGKLDYLQELGVTALWLQPFYPSPGRDDGYDISDYGTVNADFGTMRDFRRFIVEAKRRGLRVITELVINHTSDQHPWFKRARRSPPGSSARNWYVWSDSDQKYRGTRIIFTDTEKSNWTWDAEAGAYYWHRFFSHQPDLNFDNPRVVSAVMQVMKRWLDAGVDGFRLDAIPYLCEREGTSNENLPETHAIIKTLRRELDAYAHDKIFLAEANQWPEDVQEYFGDGDECHMAYHFPLMPRIYMAIAQEDRFPITDILRQTPDVPPNCQWALFLRNHDELTLEMVTDVERDYLWSTYAHDPRARINLGIRRRLAPLMDNDRRKIELMNSLLLSFPGTPIIYYGDEIGMGDNIYLGDRNGVRTPMQWSPDRNGGFSRCDPARLYAPVIMDSVYGYEAVNVEAQSRSLSSLLSWTKRMISVRKSSAAFGRGTITFVRPANRTILAYIRHYGDEIILCIANLSRAAQACELDLSPWKDRAPLEMLGRTTFPPIGELPYLVTLAPYGFYWFKLIEKPEATRAPATLPELETLVVPAGAVWDTLGRTRSVFESEVLPQYLALAPWFPERSQYAIMAKLLAVVPCSGADDALRTWLVFCRATDGGHTGCWVLPLRIDWARFDRTRYNPNILAAVRQGARQGALVDVALDKDFVARLIDNLRHGLVLESQGARLEFHGTRKLADAPSRPVEAVRALPSGQGRSATVVDASFLVTICRHLESGIDPGVEASRFLTETVGFTGTPALLGHVEATCDGEAGTIATVFDYIENQGDAWTLTGSYLDRLIEEHKLLGAIEDDAQSTYKSQYDLHMERAGQQVAELHAALASRDDIAAFAPEPTTRRDIQSWVDGILAQAARVFESLDRLSASASGPDRELIARVTAIAPRLHGDLLRLRPEAGASANIRHHGDLHLTRLLIVKDDIFVVGFEDAPDRPPAARRGKAPAARDVASLIRSIDYAATAALERALNLDRDAGHATAEALDAWRRRSVTTLLDAYWQNLGDTRLWPAAPAARMRMLDFFLLERLFHEIEHELAHRPAWLSVPLAGLLRLLARQSGAEP